MSSTYRVRGARWLRLYTAETTTPVYGAPVDAQTAADSLCNVPWERARIDSGCRYTAHTNATLDSNIANRQLFDAALWCAGHESGMHRAYANAAIYKICLPDAAVGKTLEAVSVLAAADPYCASGLRIAVHLSDDGELPTDCGTVRTGVAHAEGAVPRRAETVTANGADTTYWYVSQGTVEIPLDPPQALTRYLMVFVGLENYATARNNWLEGSGYIRNSIALTLTEAVEGWDESAAPVDCAPDAPSDAGSVQLCTGGCVPPWTGGTSPVLSACLCMHGGVFAGAADAMPDNADNPAAGLSAAYAAMFARSAIALPVAALPPTRPGAGYTVWRGVEAGDLEADYGRVRGVPVWRIAQSAFLLPFFVKRATLPVSINMSWTAPDPATGTLRLWLARGTYLEEPPADHLADGAFHASALQIGDAVGDYTLIGQYAAGAGEATAIVDPIAEPLATLMLTAYTDISDIDMDSTAAQGVGALRASHDGQTATGWETLIVPNVTLS